MSGRIYRLELEPPSFSLTPSPTRWLARSLRNPPMSGVSAMPEDAEKSAPLTALHLSFIVWGRTTHILPYRVLESMKYNAAQEYQPALTGLTAQSCNLSLQ